ncbi:helix-turn-helix domain-containing protein [Commensalibacter melissae]|uniref:helix-turn-helix domain-containing protein n=1 Tax=Commensalibacter melissae TaxID=2070537 RepID=UPI0018DE3D2B|nr:helix-turn-helix transcriptional regulator [Commensalibacter melissae]MBH9973854.1 helix-turn-helix transcriptional regulator [Commensalibacter melissae]
MRLARSCRNITKKYLSKLVNVSPLTLTRLEKGCDEPRKETVQLLVKALNFPEAFFFDGIEEDQDKEDLNTKDLSFRSNAKFLEKTGMQPIQQEDWLIL